MSDKRLSHEEVEILVSGTPDTEFVGRAPVDEGIVDGKIDSPSMSELKKLPALKRVELSDSLSSLTNDFVFFNHTMLFSKGGLDFDPLMEYQAWCGKDSAVNYMVFNRKIFNNFDFPDKSGGHDSLLAFTTVEHWPVIEKAIGSLTILNRSKDYMFLCELAKVKIPDPKNPKMFIEPYIWNLRGSICSWECSGYPVPQLIKKPANYEAKRLMRAIKNERLDP
jgi:hypothetical protein